MVRENQTGQQSPNHKMHAELPQEITNAHQMALYHYQLRQRYDTMMGTALHSEHQRQHVPNMLNPYNTNPRIGANAFAPTNPLIHPAFPLLNFNANLSDSRIGNPSLDALMLQRGNTSSAGNFLYPNGHQFPLQPNVLGELAVNNSFGQQPEVPRTQPQMPLVNELHYVPFRNPHQHAGEAGERIRRMPVAFFPFASVAGHESDQPDAVAHAGILNNFSLHQSKTQPETHHPYKVQPRRLSPQRKNGDEGYSSNTHNASSLTAQQNRSKRAKEEPSASQPSCKVHKLSAMPQQLPVESAPNLMSSSTSQQQADVVYEESCIGSMAASEYHVARQSTGSNPRSPDSSNYNQLIHYRNFTLGAHERKPIHTTSSKTSRHTEIYVEEKDSTYSPKTQKKSKKSNKHAPGTNSVGLEQKLQQRTPSKNESDPLSINGFQQQHASGEHRQLNRICMPHYYYPSAVAHHTHYSSNNISEISDNTNHEPSPHQRNTIPEAPTASAVQPKYTQPLRDSKYEDISDDEYDDVSSTQCSTYSLAAFKNNSKNAEETSSTLSSLGQEQSQQQSLVSSLKLMPASSFQPRYNKVNPPVHERSTALTSEFYRASQSKSGYPIVADTSQNNHLEENWCGTAAALEKRPKQNMPPQNKARKEISVTNRNIVDLSSAVKSKSNMADNQPPMTSYRREESLKPIAQQEHVLSSTGVAQHTTEVDEQVKNLPTANSSLDHTKQGSLDDDSKASGTVHHAHGRKMAQKMANSHEKHANRPFPTQNNMNTEYFPTADTALNTKNERIETNTESQNTYGNVSDSTPARLNPYYTSLNSRTTMQLTQPTNVYQQNSEVDERDNGKAVAFSLSATEQNCRGLQTINEHRKISNISGYSHTHHPFKTKLCETLTAHPEKPVEMLVSGNKGYEKLYSEITHYSTDLSTTQKNMETINFIDIQNSHNNVNGSIMKHSDPITSRPTYNPIEDQQEFRNSKLQFRTNVYMTDRIFAHPPPPLHHIDLNTLDVISAPPKHLTSVPHSRLPLVENFLYPHGHLLQPGSYATRESTSANNFIHEESTSPVIKQPTPLINAPEPMTPCNLQRDGAVDQRLNRMSTAIPSFPSRTEHHGELATRNAYQELPDTLQYSLLPHQKYAMPSTRDDYEKQSKTTTTQGEQRSSLNTDFQSPESQSGPPQLMKISPLERPNACFTANRGRPGLQPSPGDYGSPPILDRQVSPIVGGVDEEETKVDCHEYLPSERHFELPNQIGMRTASAAGVSPTLSELRFTLNSTASVTNTIYKPCFSNYSADKVENNKANAALRLENPNQGESSHESSFPKTSFESTPKRPKPTAHRSRKRRNDKYQVNSELPIRRRLPKEKSPKSDGFLNSTVGSFMGNNINKSLPQNTEDMPEYQNSSAKQQKHRLSTSGQGHKNLPLKKRNLKNWQNVPEYTVDTHKQDHTFIPSNRATDSLSKIFKDTAQPHFIKCKNQNEAEMNYVDVLSSGATSSESNLSATAEQGLTATNSISAHQRLPSYGANNQSELREATVITNANSNALTSNLLTETDKATKTLQANDVAFYQFYGEHNSDDSEDDNVGRLVMEDL